MPALPSETITIIVFLSLIILLIGILFLLQGPPYVPTDDEIIKDILFYIRKYKKKHIIDLGSGDGKILIAIAKSGYSVTGVEINPILVWQSKQLVKRHRLQKKISIIWGNFWTLDLSKYDVVIIYGIKHIMKKLGDKLKKTLKKDAVIITNYFTFPTWKQIEKRGKVNVYKKPV